MSDSHFTTTISAPAMDERPYRFDGKVFSTWPLTFRKHGPMFGIKSKFGNDGLANYMPTFKHFECRMCGNIIETDSIGLKADICACPNYNGGTHRSMPTIRRHTVLRLRNLRDGVAV